ncbi:hypothetical protein GEV33_011315 [Tenebrio molitor]|uniref:DUF4802 domain-containing protein n=1 Tax=Tenebrio molitor TaxID=7067 RepID=A0A8J6HCD0_TENMO|nr:hypothetical protein GEV33_011315 [Tenebrio molitor]
MGFVSIKVVLFQFFIQNKSANSSLQDGGHKSAAAVDNKCSTSASSPASEGCRRSSIDLYEEAASILGLTCSQTDDCKCIECQVNKSPRRWRRRSPGIAPATAASSARSADASDAPGKNDGDVYRGNNFRVEFIVGGVVKRSVFNVYPSAAPPHPRDSYIQSKHVRTRLELKFQSEPTDVVSQNRSKLEQQNIWIGGRRRCELHVTRCGEDLKSMCHYFDFDDDLECANSECVVDHNSSCTIQ